MLQRIKSASFRHKFECLGFFAFWIAAFMLISNYERYADDLVWMETIERMGGWWNTALFYFGALGLFLICKGI